MRVSVRNMSELSQYKRHKKKRQAYYQAHKAKIQAQMREWYAKNKERVRDWQRAHPNRNNGNSTRTPEQVRAHHYIQRHPELRGSKCELCPSIENLTAHHPDYDFPEIIVTCCRGCHGWIEKELCQK